MLKIVFAGGTYRAVNPFKSFLLRDDLKIEYAVFMPGYEDEKIHCDNLTELARSHDIDYVVSDEITPAIIDRIKEIQPDVIIGGGVWRSMVPTECFKVPRYGWIGLHNSGLPEYRGWAGINWYILNGEKEFVTRMVQTDKGLDAGPLVADEKGNLLEYRMDIDNENHLSDIIEQFNSILVKAFNDLIDLLVAGKVTFINQDHSRASYTCHRGPDDGEIDWSWPTKNILNFIRAQAPPCPGAFSFYKNKKFIITRATIPDKCDRYVGRIMGKVVGRHPSGEVDILTGDGTLRIREITVEGKKIRPNSFINSVRQSLGYNPRKAIEALERRIEDLERRI